MVKIYILRPVEKCQLNVFGHLAFTGWKTIPQELKNRYNDIKTIYTYDGFDYLLTVEWLDGTMADYYIQKKELIENE